MCGTLPVMAFDTHALVKTLTDAGATEALAVAVVKVAREAADEALRIAAKRPTPTAAGVVGRIGEHHEVRIAAKRPKPIAAPQQKPESKRATKRKRKRSAAAKRARLAAAAQPAPAPAPRQSARRAGLVWSCRRCGRSGDLPVDPNDSSLCMACGIKRKPKPKLRSLLRTPNTNQKRKTSRKPSKESEIPLSRTPLAGGPVKGGRSMDRFSPPHPPQPPSSHAKRPIGP